MRRQFALMIASQPFADGPRPVAEAIGAVSLCVTFVGLMFLPGLV